MTPAEALAAELIAIVAAPVYVGDEPRQPDSCVTVYDTGGTVYAAAYGMRIAKPGVQVRCRSGTYAGADAAAAAVAAYLDSRPDYVRGPVVHMGQERTSERWLVSVNAQVLHEPS